MTKIRELKYNKEIVEKKPRFSIKIFRFKIGSKLVKTTWPVLEGCWCGFCTGKKEIFEGYFADIEWCRHQVFCEVTEREYNDLDDAKLAELKKTYENETWIPMA